MFKQTITTITIKGGTLEFPPASTEPIVADNAILTGEFVLDPPPEDEILADIMSGEPDIVWGSEGPPHPYRPWSWETCMIVAMAAIAPISGLAVWGILKCVL